MPRESILIPSRELSYEGYFAVKDVLSIITRFLEEHSYMRIDRVHEHKQLAEGTLIEIRGFHERFITDHDKFEFDIFVTFSKIKDVEVTAKHGIQKMNSGRMSLTLKGILFTDWENDWSSKESNYGYGAFIRWISDTFIFSEQTAELRASCKKDVDDLYATLVEYFSAQSYRRE